jgi:hypothetical protein
MARALAASRIATLRLDIRSLGDSIRRGAPDENHPYPATAVQDVASALAWLSEKRGFDHFVVGGICSGAHTAFHCGLELEHPGLVGLLIVNPLTFYWHTGLSLAIPPAYQTIKDTKHYKQSVRDPQSWFKLLRGQADVLYIADFVWRRTRESVKRRLRPGLEALRLKPQTRLSKDLQALQAMGRRVDFIFSSSDPGRDIVMSDAGPAVRRLERAGILSLSIVPNADHTFSRREWREQLSALSIDRMMWYVGQMTNATEKPADRAQ